MKKEVYNISKSKEEAKLDFQTQLEVWINTGRVLIGISLRPEVIDEPGEYLKAIETVCKNTDTGERYQNDEVIETDYWYEYGYKLTFRREFRQHIAVLMGYFNRGEIDRVWYTSTKSNNPRVAR